MFPNLVRASTLAMLVLSATSMGAGAPPMKESAHGLKAEIVVNKDTYALDPAQSGQAFRDKMKNLREQAPATPAVDLTLRLTNTGDQPMTLNIGGDATQITLKLAGPGALTVEPMVPMTMEFRMGKPTVIAAGKSLDIKIANLSGGMRGITQASYWTEPGDYTLIASFQQSNEDNTVTKVSSESAKLKVTK